MDYNKLPVHQQEQLCRELALQPFTRKQVQHALNRSKELGCRYCDSRKFGAYGLVAHCRAKHPNVAIRIWKALRIAL